MRLSYLEPLEARIAPATISIAPVIVDEGDENTPDNIIHYKVKLDGASASPVTVHYEILNTGADGNAVVGQHINPVSGSTSGDLTFNPGEVETTIDIAVLGNSTVDSDHFFTVKLSNPNGDGVTLGNNTAKVTIWDDDRTVQFDAASLGQTKLEGAAGTTSLLNYNITLSAPAEHDITVAFKTIDGTGYGGAISHDAAADFIAADSTVTFLAGSTTPVVKTVSVKGDALPGPDETFTVALSKPATNTGAFGVKLAANATTTATIQNDDGSDTANPVTVSLVGNVNVAEGADAQFQLQLSRLSESDIVVTYHTVDGTATGADYALKANGSVATITSGTLQSTLPIHVNTDSVIEGAEQFSVALEAAKVNGVAQTLGTQTATATIAADAFPKLKVSGPVEIFENANSGHAQAVFTVTFDLAAGATVQTTEAASFDYTTVNGTAVSGSDYTAASGHVIIPANSTEAFTKQITVDILTDSVVESTETFALKLSAGDHVDTSGSNATFTTKILDANVQLKVANLSFNEGSNGTNTAVFTAALGKAVPAGYKLLIDYTTADDTTGANPATSTAGAQQDYAAASGTLEYLEGATVKTVAVNVIGDQVLESNETFKLKFSNARLVKVSDNTSNNVILANTPTTGADAGKIVATGTILNDEAKAITAAITAKDATLLEGAAGSTTRAEFDVTLSGQYSSDVKVGYTITKTAPDGTTSTTVVAASDANALVIPAYSSSPAQTLKVDFVKDSTVAHDQVITVTLNEVVPVAASGGATFLPLASAKTATTTVLEDDALVRISDANKSEGASGTSLMPFQVELVNAQGNLVKLDHAVVVPFRTVEGAELIAANPTIDITQTATSSGTQADFVAASGSLTFRPGENQTNINVTIKGDTLPSAIPGEIFAVQLHDVTGASIDTAHGAARGTIINDDAVLPVLTVSPGSGAEGGKVNFTVSLSQASDSPVTFQYTTSDGTAVAASDYTAVTTPTTVVIQPGQTSAVVQISTIDDVANEGAETLNLNLTNLKGVSNAASTATAVGTIAASDQPTLLLTATGNTLEGDSGTHDIVLDVHLSAATDRDVTFDIKTFQTSAANSATPGTDYVALTKHVTITAGSTTPAVPVTLTINGDLDNHEGDEVVQIRIDNVDGASPTQVDAVRVIQNDDAKITIAGPSTGVTEAAGAFATFTVTRDGDLSQAVTVSYQTMDGTAVSTGANPDFVAVTDGTVTFAAGKSTAEIKVALVDNNRHEADEQFSVLLTGATNAVLGSTSTASATIKDNDALPIAKLSGPVTINETDSGTTNATFTVTLDRANEAEDVVFTYGTTDGTAKTATGDYVAANGTVTIAKGSLTQSFTVAVNNDLTYDSAKSEFFNVNLSLDSTHPGTATLGTAAGTPTLASKVTIVDNDLVPQVSISPVTVTEGEAPVFNVLLNHASDNAVTVKYYTVDGTAKSTGATPDYVGHASTSQGSLTFAPGITQATISDISTIDEAGDLVEGNENFKVQLAAPVGATLSTTGGSALVTIVDNDVAYLTVNDVSIVEGNGGTTNAIFTVTLIGDTVAPVTFKYATSSDAAADGVATAGVDYIATAGSLTLGGTNGQHTAQIAVKVIGDLGKENSNADTSLRNEKFKLSISDATVATIAQATGIGTIMDDGDTLASLSIDSAVAVEGDGSDTVMHFTAHLSDAAPDPTANSGANAVSFTVKTSEILKAANVARLGTDFVQPKSSTAPNDDLVVTFAAGATTATFDITIKGDTSFEPVEFFNVTATNIKNAQPAGVNATGTIYDNDLFLSATSAKWTDVDGDLVTLSVSKGNLGNVIPISNTFETSGADVGTMGGRILQRLDLVSFAGTSFTGANLSITSAQQPNAAGTLVGDGLVNVGYIHANTYDSAPSALEVTGIDMGTITIDGDLSRMDVGDLYSNLGLVKLDAYSLGVKSATTEIAPSSTTFFSLPAISNILAGVGTLKLTNDLSGQVRVTGGTFGTISSLQIGGALRGTTADDSGRVLLTGALASATIHDIIGGDGDRSGSLTQFDTTASAGTITITGDLKAGTGDQSGHILFPKITSVKVGGSIIGNGTAGGGFISGSNSLGSVTIDHDLSGGAKIYGGGLTNNVAIDSVTIHGNVNDGKILGGYIGNLSTTAANRETKANADAIINKVVVDGSVLKFDILAGTDPRATSSSSPFSRDDASLFSRIASVVINGAVQTNPTAYYVSAQSLGSVLIAGQPKVGSLAGTDLGTNSNFLLKYSF